MCWSFALTIKIVKKSKSLTQVSSGPTVEYGICMRNNKARAFSKKIWNSCERHSETVRRSPVENF